MRASKAASFASNSGPVCGSVESIFGSIEAKTLIMLMGFPPVADHGGMT
jgi:hypothetical protein